MYAVATFLIVISVTMFVGNLDIPTPIVTVVVGLVAPSTSELTTRLFVLVAGIAVVVLLAFLRPVTRLFVELGRRTARPVMREAFHGDVEELLKLGTHTEAGRRDPQWRHPAVQPARPAERLAPDPGARLTPWR
jgi:hypothetical protein